MMISGFHKKYSRLLISIALLYPRTRQILVTKLCLDAFIACISLNCYLKVI